jgi:mannosyltransferase
MALPEVYPERAKSIPTPTKSTWAVLPSTGIGLATLVAIGLALRVSHLTSKPFWFDECFSVELARLRLGSFLRVIWWREANMSLYYALLRAWLHLAHSEFFIRSLSVLFAAATIPAIYWLGWQLYGRRIAFLASGLFTFNAYNVRYSQEARSYTLLVLLATLSSGFFVSWLRNGKRWSRTAYILATILAMYAHFYALLLIAAQWIVLRLFGAPRPENGEPTQSAHARVLPWKAIGLGVLPLLVFVGKTGAGPIRWIQRPGLHDLAAFWRDFCGGVNWMLPAIFTIALIAAAAISRKGLIRRNQAWETWRIQFLLLWLLFPIILTVVLSFPRPVFLARFLIFCQPALVILVAAAVAGLRRGWVIAPLLALILVLAVQGILFVYGHDYDDQRDGSGAAVNYILDHSLPGDAILFHIAEARVPYEFFRSLRANENTASPKFTGRLGPEILFPNFGPGLDYGDFKAKPIPEILRSELPNYSRVWVMFMYNQGGGAGKTTAMLSQMLPQVFPHRECRDFPKVEVCLYSKDRGTEVGTH